MKQGVARTRSKVYLSAMSFTGFRHSPVDRHDSVLPRVARLGVVLLGHAGLAVWALGAAVAERLPPQPLRMDVSLVPHVAPAAQPVPGPPAPVPLRQAQTPPPPIPEPVVTPPAPQRVSEPAAKPKPKPKPKPIPRAKPQAAPVAAEPVRQASPAPHPVSDAAVVPAAAVSEPSPVTTLAPPVAPALVEARFDADYLRNPAPVYPPMSRRRGEQGKVLVLVVVTPDGLAGEVSLRESSGYPRLDGAALKAVRGWRFVPARRGANPVAATVVVPITFRLEG